MRFKRLRGFLVNQNKGLNDNTKSFSLNYGKGAWNRGLESGTEEIAIINH